MRVYLYQEEWNSISTWLLSFPHCSWTYNVTFELIYEFGPFLKTLLYIYDYVTFHIPHLTLGLPHMTFFLSFWQLHHSIHKWCGKTHGCTWHSDEIGTSRKLTMMTWTPWWNGNDKLFLLFLSLQYSWKIFFVLNIHPLRDWTLWSRHVVLIFGLLS